MAYPLAHELRNHWKRWTGTSKHNKIRRGQFRDVVERKASPSQEQTSLFKVTLTAMKAAALVTESLFTGAGRKASE